MPKWKKNATEFTVGVSYHELRGYQSSIPRPVVDALGIHDDKSRDPNRIVYAIKKNRVEIKGEMTMVNRARKKE